jgi:hypothetical protein
VAVFADRLAHGSPLAVITDQYALPNWIVLHEHSSDLLQAKTRMAEVQICRFHRRLFTFFLHVQVLDKPTVRKYRRRTP